MTLSNQIKGENVLFDLSLESISETAKYRRAQDFSRMSQFNKDVKSWANNVTSLLRGSVKSSVMRDLSLSSSIKPHLYYDKKYAREVNRIGFSFRREGIYIHKGAGKGQGGYKGGSKWTDKYGNLKQTDPKSFFKMGTGNRKPIEWFNNIIKKELENLADIVANYSSDLQIDSTKIFIRD